MNNWHYRGKRVYCFYTHVKNWKEAVCGKWKTYEWQIVLHLKNILKFMRYSKGLFLRNKCENGQKCNYMHVFANPYNDFPIFIPNKRISAQSSSVPIPNPKPNENQREEGNKRFRRNETIHWSPRSSSTRCRSESRGHYLEVSKRRRDNDKDEMDRTKRKKEKSNERKLSKKSKRNKSPNRRSPSHKPNKKGY